ncbi:MAG: hypothetical protein JW931_05480 [Methanomicrobiaceae archaeon]|nr:hypothetical protein [Methanomicrobiaceae archaeon]
MESNTTKSRAGWALLAAILLIAAIILILFFLEYLLIGFLLLAGMLIVLALAAIAVSAIMIVPMYALKGTVVEEGSYSMGDVKAVENERKD